MNELFENANDHSSDSRPEISGVSDELTALLTALPPKSDDVFSVLKGVKKEEGNTGDIANTMSPNSSLKCDICNDAASGRHYGAIACNGCKGFFRRTIRRGHKYECRFNENCAIDKHTRAVCRYCRYIRCIKSGMKVDAVQNERDAIGKRSRMESDVTQTCAEYVERVSNTNQSSFNSTWNHPKVLLESLIQSESMVNQLRDTVIKQTGNVEYATRPRSDSTSSSTIVDGSRKATVDDVGKSIHSQLLLVVEWSKTLSPFATLPMEDQMALLKNFAAQHVVLGVAYRSIGAGDLLKLMNGTIIPRHYREETDFPCRDGDKIIDELVVPMRFLKIDDVEFCALKACILFNPVAKGLSRKSVMPVLQTRRKIYAALEHYLNGKIPSDPARLGDLTFFVLSPLQAAANSIAEDLLIAKLIGVARIDVLMEELMLVDEDDRQLKDVLSTARSPPTLSQSINNRSFEIPETTAPPSHVFSASQTIGEGNFLVDNNDCFF